MENVDVQETQSKNFFFLNFIWIEYIPKTLYQCPLSRQDLKWNESEIWIKSTVTTYTFQYALFLGIGDIGQCF